MEEKEYYLLITRYLSQQTDTEENEILADWIAASSDNELIFEEIKTVWQLAMPVPHPQTKSALGRLQSKIREEQAQEVRQVSYQRNWYGIAASLLAVVICLGAGYQYLLKDQESHVMRQFTTAGEKKSFSLDDGTKVVLAPRSSLSYPSRLGRNTRIVNLAGEAYFEVSKNKHRPFVVHTDKLDVHVLGTHFNVRNSDRANSTAVSLLEGKVNVTLAGDDQEVYEIKPGQEILYNHLSHQVYQHEFDTDAVTGWMKNILVFKNERLVTAAEKINQLYGVTIIFADQATADTRLYATFKNESLIDVMEMIKATGNVAYHITGNKVYLTLKH